MSLAVRAFVFAVVLLVPARALALNFAITTTSGGNGVQACTDDAANPKTNCSLEEALQVAQNVAGDDTITLAAGSGGKYSTANKASPTVPFGALVIDASSITIVGAGMGMTILDGAGTSGVMAISSGGSGNITIKDLTITNGFWPTNTTNFTAGLSGGPASGTFTIERVELKNNTGGTRAAGGHLSGNSGTIVVKDCVISGNKLTAGGNAPGLDIWTNFNGKVVVTGNKVQDNIGTDTYFGGMRVLTVSGGSSIEVRNNIFTGNSGGGTGGFAIDVKFTSGPVIVANNVFAKNTSTSTSQLYTAGGVAVLTDAKPITIDFVNNTIVGNTAAKDSGGAMFYTALAGGGTEATSNIYNNLFSGNSAPAGKGKDLVVRANATTSPTFNVHNNLESEVCFTTDATTFECNLANAPLVKVAGEVHADPMFVNAASGDYHLAAGSPAIDTGDSAAPNVPTTDFAGAPRVVGPKVDIGAYEAQPDISLEPASVDFGEVAPNQTKTQTVTVANKGAGAMSVSAVSLSGGAPFSVDGKVGPNGCGDAPFAVAGGKSCTLTITFAPTANGTFENTLDVDSNDADSAKKTLAVKGVGGAGGGGTSSSGGTGSSGTNGAGSDGSSDDGGCSCSQVGGRSTGALGMGSLLFALGLVIRRAARSRARR